jgi:hypothetical protein
MKFEIDREVGDAVYIINNGNICRGYVYSITFTTEIISSLWTSEYNDYNVKENTISALKIIVKADINQRLGYAKDYKSFDVKEEEIYDTKKDAAKAMLLNAGFICGLEGIEK